MSWIRFDYLDASGIVIGSDTISVRLTKSANSLIAECGTQWRFRTTIWRGGRAAGLQPWGRSGGSTSKCYRGVCIRATPSGDPVTEEAPWTVRHHKPNATSVSVSIEPSLNDKIWEIMGPACGHEAVRQEAHRRQCERDEWARQSALAFNEIHQRCTWRIVEVTSHTEYIMMMELQWQKLEELRSAQREAERRWPTDLSENCIGDAGDIGEFLLGVETNGDLNCNQED